MAGCFHCGSPFPHDFEIHRSTNCPSCGKDAKVCLNCQFYAPGQHWECNETIPERVKEKDRANFCDYFRLNPKAGGDAGPSKAAKKAEEARSQFESLFGND